MPDIGDQTEREMDSVTEEIARYMRQRGKAADTLEGITHWWLLRQRLYEGRQQVEHAVDYLCRIGVVESRTLPDGSVVYSAATKKNDQAE